MICAPAAFGHIVDHKEDYMSLHGMRTGFICYILRYWLRLCTNQRVEGFNESHFVVGALSLLGDLDPVQCQRVKIKPSPRCLTLFSWLQVGNN